MESKVDYRPDISLAVAHHDLRPAGRSCWHSSSRGTVRSKKAA